MIRREHCVKGDPRYTSPMLDRWTRWVIRHRVAVVGVWAVIAVIGGAASFAISGLLSTSLSVPGSDSQRADVILSQHFAQNVEGTFTVVVPFGQATTAQLHSLESAVARATLSVPAATVVQQKALGGILYVNVATPLNLIHAADQTTVLRSALRTQGVLDALVTGPPALDHDLAPVLSHDLRVGEVIAASLALILLVLVLGWCWAVTVPLVVAGATTAGAVALVYLMAQHVLMVLYIPNVIELISLGLAVDYSLLMVHRYRSELALHDEAVEAVVATMQSAGRTIALSGVTVAIGLATLFLVPVPFVQSLGAAGLVVPVVAVLAGLTLQPALLSLVGRRGVRPRGVRGLLARSDPLGGRWARVARLTQRRPRTLVLVALGALAVMGSGVGWLELTPGSVVAVPSNLESSRAIQLIAARVGPGIISPVQIVIDFGRAGVAGDAVARRDRLQLATAILHDPEVFAVAIDNQMPFVDLTGRYEQLFVFGRHEFGAPQSQQLVRDLRDHYVADTVLPSGSRVYVGGAPAQGVDFLSSVYGSFPWIVALALALAFLFLVRAFRSLLLAALAIVLDLVSVTVAYGLIVEMFRFGIGSRLLGTYQVSQIEGWVPIFLFAVLFGLSMDYEVFIVSRVREAWLESGDSSQAIVEGLARTGGVVSAAALILVGALGGLVLGHVAGLQELGVGLALGILIDASVVRAILLPSAMGLLGRWSWWLPSWIARPLRVTAAPLTTRRGRP
jgi:RND superfamily putative drug exporter